jgi:hypothetical protein
MAAGIAAAVLWSLRAALAPGPRGWRAAQAAAAALALLGAAAVRTGPPGLAVLAGLALLAAALALLIGWRQPGRLVAGIHLAWGMVLAAGLPVPWAS